MSISRLIFVAFVVFFVFSVAFGQSYKKDDEVEKPNKFKGQERRSTIDVKSGLDATKSTVPKCKHELDLLWHTKLATEIFGTPRIADLKGDGKKDILVAGLTGLYAVDGQTGKQIDGSWPIVISDDELVASPLLYDIDRDGKDELLVASNRGYIMFFSHNGDFDINYTLHVPPAYLLKDWNTGKSGLNDPYMLKKDPQLNGNEDEEENEDVYVDEDWEDELNRWESEDDEEEEYEEEVDEEYDVEEALKGLDSDTADSIMEDAELLERLSTNTTELWNVFHEKLTPEGVLSLELFLPSKPTVSPDHKEKIAARSFHRWIEKHKPKDDLSKYIEVPGHLIDTPIIADLEKDGHDELIVAVSYNFADSDKFLEDYPDLEMNNYVAGAICVFDLRTLDMKWMLLLDVTTDNTDYKGFIYGPPTVIDLDGDGFLEILVGTASGMIYVIDNHGTGPYMRHHDEGSRFSVEWLFWVSLVLVPTDQLISSPGKLKTQYAGMMMDVIYAGLTAEDIDGDGRIDIIASDRLGNVVAYDHSGSEKWETRVTGAVHANAVVGDVNDDGQLDVIVASDAGGVYAFSGKDGSLLANFPVNVGDAVMGGPLLIRMNPKDNQLHIAVATTKGHLFIINTFDGCIESIEFGGSSHSMVLADDFFQNGTMDLVVTTDEGDVYLVSSEAPYDPMVAWNSASRNRNVFSYTSKNTQGVRFTDEMRRREHVSGEEFKVEFEIFDNRDRLKFAQPALKQKYLVQESTPIYIGSRLLYMDTLSSPGYNRVTVHCPPVRLSTDLKVRVTNEHGQVYEDSFGIDINAQFYRIIKWILTVPFLLMGVMMLALDNVKDFFQLPS